MSEQNGKKSSGKEDGNNRQADELVQHESC